MYFVPEVELLCDEKIIILQGRCRWNMKDEEYVYIYDKKNCGRGF